MDKLSNIYLDELVSWNERFNLTGLKNKDEIKSKLYEDSLNISKAVHLEKNIKVIDIGCGAGFPGIPLKIENPEIELTLIDSIAKKISFVKHIIEMMDLKDTNAVCARAEDYARDHMETFELAVSRAVAKLPVLAEYCLPFVKIGGTFIAQKGPDIEEEILSAKKAIDILGGRQLDLIQVPSGYLVVIEKVKHTPDGYPRRAGIPGKKPI